MTLKHYAEMKEDEILYDLIKHAADKAMASTVRVSDLAETPFDCVIVSLAVPMEMFARMLKNMAEFDPDMHDDMAAMLQASFKKMLAESAKDARKRRKEKE